MTCRVRGAFGFALSYIVLAAGFLGNGCVTVRRVTCDTVSCSGDDCGQQGREALERGEPDVALCHFRQAIATGNQDAEIRLEYGTALVLAGRPAEARKQLRFVLEKSSEEDVRELAQAWLGAVEAPLPFAVFYRPDEGLPSDAGAGREAGASLRRTLQSLGTFRAVAAQAGGPIRRGREAQAFSEAESVGARLTLIVGVRAVRTTELRNPTILGGLLQIRNITKYTSTVQLTIEAYQTQKRERRATLEEDGTASNIVEKAAIWGAVDAGVGGLALRLAKELLYGSSEGR